MQYLFVDIYLTTSLLCIIPMYIMLQFQLYITLINILTCRRVKLCLCRYIETKSNDATY